MIIGKALIVPAPTGPNKILDKNTWEVIKQVSDKNQGQNYWAVGDCKQVTMNGGVSSGLTLSNYTAWVYIIGFNHNAELEGNGIAFQGFKTAQTGGTDICLVDSGYGDTPRHTGEPWFSMNESSTNAGGWEASQMRTKIMPLIKAALPSDLQAVIKTSTIYTDNVGGGTSAKSNVTSTQDDIYLLAEYEVFGSRLYANTYEASKQQQYAYYAAGNSRVKYKFDATSSAAFWRERSPLSGNANGFCVVRTDGNAGIPNASLSYGVAPAFKI